MAKKRDPYGVTPAYLAWKRKGSPGVFDREKDRQIPVEEIHDDPVVASWRSTPMTRENYLELAYLKKNPVLSAEEEPELSSGFRAINKALNNIRQTVILIFIGITFCAARKKRGRGECLVRFFVLGW
jgi:hypothetical protein